MSQARLRVTRLCVGCRAATGGQGQRAALLLPERLRNGQRQVRSLSEPGGDARCRCFGPARPSFPTNPELAESEEEKDK